MARVKPAGIIADVRLRAALVPVLVVLVALAAPAAAVALWARDTVLDGHGYLKAVDPIVREPAVRDAIARRTAAAVTGSAGTLPPAAVARVRAGARELAASDRFAAVWHDANVEAHAAARRLLAGTGARRPVVLDLGGLVELVVARLQAEGVPVDPAAVAGRGARITVLERSDAGAARDVARWTERLAVVLPAIVGGGIVALLLAARRRGAALVALGLLGAAAFALTDLGARGAQGAAAMRGDGLDAVVERAYAAALAHPLRSSLQTGAVASLAVAAAGLLLSSLRRRR